MLLPTKVSRSLSSSFQMVRYESSKAEVAYRKYLEPWPRELQEQAKNSTNKPVDVPQFIIGTAGKIAMQLWQAVATVEGAAALNRTEKELYVFSTFAQSSSRWQDLLNTPEAFLPLEEKSRLMHYLLTQELGCSVVFLDLMNGSLKRLQQISVDFCEINRSHRREIDVKLVTGKKLNQASLEFYKNTISLDYLDPADNMIFTYAVDPSITGYKIFVKNKLFDFTQDDDIKRAEQTVASSGSFNAKESLVKDFAGVLASNDIENFWKDIQASNNRS